MEKIKQKRHNGAWLAIVVGTRSFRSADALLPVKLMFTNSVCSYSLLVNWDKRSFRTETKRLPKRRARPYCQVVKGRALINIVALCILFLSGCYSFTGGTIPAHIKTLQIASVVDQSGFGSPEYKIELETAITNNFMRDNSFELAETLGDAKLSVSIVSIAEATSSVSVAELETEKRITVTCSVEYYDNVNKKQFWKRNFSSYGLFDINSALTARNETLLVVFNQLAEDIMLAVVSGW